MYLPECGLLVTTGLRTLSRTAALWPTVELLELTLLGRVHLLHLLLRHLRLSHLLAHLLLSHLLLLAHLLLTHRTWLLLRTWCTELTLLFAALLGLRATFAEVLEAHGVGGMRLKLVVEKLRANIYSV